MTITAATPMMMPSMVSAERSLLTRSAPRAMRRMAAKLMRSASGQRRRRVAWRVRLVLDHLAVAEVDHAPGEGGDVVLVGDQHDGDAVAG